MFDRSTLKKNETMYTNKSSFAGYVDVDLKDNKLSLRSLVSSRSSLTKHLGELCPILSIQTHSLTYFFRCLFIYLQIDNSVVESFGAGGKVCITSRAYPTLAINEKAHLYAFNNGTEPITIETLDAWSMGKAKIQY